MKVFSILALVVASTILMGAGCDMPQGAHRSYSTTTSSNPDLDRVLTDIKRNTGAIGDIREIRGPQDLPPQLQTGTDYDESRIFEHRAVRNGEIFTDIHGHVLYREYTDRAGNLLYVDRSGYERYKHEPPPTMEERMKALEPEIRAEKEYVRQRVAEDKAAGPGFDYCAAQRRLRSQGKW